MEAWLPTEAQGLPEDKRHVALLALAALEGAVEGAAGVSERQVVQTPVHVAGVAVVRLGRQDERESER